MNINKKLKKLRSIISFITILNFALASSVFALPEGATVQAGGVTFKNPDVSTLNVNQITDKSIIEWIKFSIANGQTVNFIQPGSESIALNRVTGASISEIFGALNANGKVWLINPNGIIFGPSSRINASGFLASTLNISNKDFLDKVYVFKKSPGTNGYIINKGQITAENGGYVGLLGDAAHNEGVVQAKLGKVIFASGEKIILELDSDGIISVTIDEPIMEIIKDTNGNKINDAVLNAETIIADGGTVILTASVLEDIFENAVNNEGLIRANSLVSNKGEVYLLAEGKNAVASNKGTIDVSASESGADGGFVEISGDIIHVGGDIKVGSIDRKNGTLLLDPVDYPIDDTEAATLEGAGGSVLIQAVNDVNFLLTDNLLDLTLKVSPDTFTVEAGNDINLNDDRIETGGANVELFSNVSTLDPVNTGIGDVVFGIGSGIDTNGGNVTLSGVNVNIMAPIGASGFVVDTVGGNFNVMGTFVLGVPDNTQTIYTYNWQYLEEDRTYKFIELGFYYYTAIGNREYIPFVIGPDIGKDGIVPNTWKSMTSGNGIIYGDIGDLELYTKFKNHNNDILKYHQNRFLNDGELEHLDPPVPFGPGSYLYNWEDLINLGGVQPEPDHNDAEMRFEYDRIIPPPVTPPAIIHAPLWWDLRFKIPKKHLTDSLQITYTKGPIELLAEQIYFYHPLTAVNMYDMPALGLEFYEFIDGRIIPKNPALLPIILEEEKE